MGMIARLRAWMNNRRWIKAYRSDLAHFVGRPAVRHELERRLASALGRKP